MLGVKTVDNGGQFFRRNKIGAADALLLGDGNRQTPVLAGVTKIQQVAVLNVVGLDLGANKIPGG